MNQPAGPPLVSDLYYDREPDIPLQGPNNAPYGQQGHMKWYDLDRATDYVGQSPYPALKNFASPGAKTPTAVIGHVVSLFSGAQANFEAGVNLYNRLRYGNFQREYHHLQQRLNRVYFDASAVTRNLANVWMNDEDRLKYTLLPVIRPTVQDLSPLYNDLIAESNQADQDTMSVRNLQTIALIRFGIWMCDTYPQGFCLPTVSPRRPDGPPWGSNLAYPNLFRVLLAIHAFQVVNGSLGQKKSREGEPYTYFDENGEVITEAVKSKRTGTTPLKKKLQEQQRIMDAHPGFQPVFQALPAPDNPALVNAAEAARTAQALAENVHTKVIVVRSYLDRVVPPAPAILAGFHGARFAEIPARLNAAHLIGQADLIESLMVQPNFASPNNLDPPQVLRPDWEEQFMSDTWKHLSKRSLQYRSLSVTVFLRPTGLFADFLEGGPIVATLRFLLLGLMLYGFIWCVAWLKLFWYLRYGSLEA